MFLKSLTLKGFKSFADPATLEMEPGVTVVVGPNGSGKSNVVDAIAWVLGAQAPSSVRSQKMDDVIFAGSAGRPALGRAEVALTIDNSAGTLPVDFSEITVRRTLFRNGDSEYAINGVPCRLLDVQELLSDSGVGRQQHVIVSQGQIDAVLNARPEDRRMVIEEAAGVLKFRRRRERSQRRLDATEGNLMRLQDLLREVRRQVRPLERQAEAARRHEALVAELHAVRVFQVGREVAALRTRLEGLQRTRAELAEAERATREVLGRLDVDVVAAEAQLGALGGFDLGDRAARLEGLRGRARGLGAVLVERRRGLERDRGGLIDAGVVANLEADAARTSTELEQVEGDAAALGPALGELAGAEAELAAERAAFEAEVAPTGVGGPSEGPAPVQAVEVRAEMSARRAARDRAEADRARLVTRVGTLAERAARLEAERVELARRVAEAEGRVPELAERRRQAERDRAGAADALARAEEDRRAADAERHSWRARADALGQALDESRARAGAERLAGLDGVVGTLLELVEVDEGWQPAFEAAAGDALAAVVVDGDGSARRALDRLAQDGGTGAVLALSGHARGVGGPVPPGAQRVRDHVRPVRPDVAALLDGLLPVAVAVDSWPQAVDLALAHPDAVVVTRAGDRFSASGWRLGVASGGATAAARDEAVARAEAAEEASRQADAVLADARRAAGEAGRAAQEAVSRAEADQRVVGPGRERLARLAADVAEAGREAEGLAADRSELDARIERERERLAELEALLPALDRAEEQATAAARAAQATRARFDERARALQARRTQLQVQAAGVDQRRAMLLRRRDELEQRLRADAVERAEAETRRVRLDRQLVAVDRLAGLVASHLERIEAEHAELAERRRRQSEHARGVAEQLDALRVRRSAEERALEAHRERAGRAEIDQAEVVLRLEQAVEGLRRELDTEPDVAMAAPAPELPEGVSPAARVRDLDRELRLLGPINPLALEEFTALTERVQFLEAQLADVQSSRRELQRVIRAIDAEIVTVFSAAYADVATNFEALFSTLFPGGQGRLILTDPADMLSTGIEVEARPSGKNVRKLSLLSGGERSLTALAFLFAVFRSRPSPFYVMDEVEAALDDVNLHRFLGLIDEFRSEAQLIVVSHQKRTMEAADCLFGVTMRPGGSSQVVSERITTRS